MRRESRPGRRIAACVLAAGLCLLQPARADTVATLKKKKADLGELKARIRDLQKEISSSEDNRSASLAALRDSERAVSEARRTLADTQQALADVRTRQGALQGEMGVVQARIDARQGELGDWLRLHYIRGRSGGLAQLLGGGGDVSAKAREAYYLEQIGRARFRLIEVQRADLAEKVRIAEETAGQAAELGVLETRYRSEQQQLEAVVARRQQAFDEISRQLAGQRNEVGNLRQDEDRMTALVEGLTRLAREEAARRAQAEREQREARERELARQEAARREAERRAAQATAGRQTAAATPSGPEAKTDEVSRPPARRPLPPVPTGVAFADLKGRLGMPVRGRVTNRFGAERSGGAMTWKGIFIQAPAGSEVAAVAPGNVVFSDWMRGFGNLIIVDHGAGYLSIYGNNDALLKQVGDRVQGGEAIAQVGASNGGADSGLYFEIRLQGQPVDPLKWVRAGN